MKEETRLEKYTRLRKAIGSQCEVAELLGVTNKTVSLRERNKIEIGNEAMLALERLAEIRSKKRARARRKEGEGVS